MGKFNCIWQWHSIYNKVSNQNKDIMKTSTKATVLLKAFDMELRAMLKRDLQNFKAIQNRKNNIQSKQLLAA